MRGQGVGRFFDALIIELKADGLTGVGDLCVHGLATRPAAELARAIGFAIHASNRHVRVQLIRQETDWAVR